MTYVTAKVWFEGKVTIEVDTNDYPQYFENNEARGGLEALFRDVFYDEAQLRGEPFVDDTSEFTEATIELPDQLP